MIKIFPRAVTDIEKQNNGTIDIDFLVAVRNSVSKMSYAGEFGLEDIESLLLAAEKVINKEDV